MYFTLNQIHEIFLLCNNYIIHYHFLALHSTHRQRHFHMRVHMQSKKESDSEATYLCATLSIL